MSLVMSFRQGENYTKLTLCSDIFRFFINVCRIKPLRVRRRGTVKFRSKNIPSIMTLSTFFGPIFTRSNKLVTEFLSFCTNSAGSCVSGNVTTISSHKPFSAIGKYKKRAKRSQVPFSCAISFAFFELFFLTKLSVAKITILAIAFANVLRSPLHSLMKVSLLHSPSLSLTKDNAQLQVMPSFLF